jgi:hypothetical protein
MPIPYVPTTHADGQSWNAAKSNALEIAVRDAQQMPAVRVNHSSNQSIPNNTLTVLAFNSEQFDQAAGSGAAHHDTATNNSRLTCLYAGIYYILVTVHIDSNATGRRDIQIRLNGSTDIAHERKTADPGGIGQQVNCDTLYALSVADYVEATVLQTSGVALNVLPLGGYSPHFMMVRVG